MRQLKEMNSLLTGILSDNTKLSLHELTTIVTPGVVPGFCSDDEMMRRLKYVNWNMEDGFLVIPPDWDKYE